MGTGVLLLLSQGNCEESQAGTAGVDVFAWLVQRLLHKPVALVTPGNPNHLSHLV